MLKRYIGISLMTIGMTVVGAELLTVAFKDLPEVRKKEKALKDMSSPEKPYKPNWFKSIKKAVKNRIEAIMEHPKEEIIIPVKVLGACLIYFCYGHSIGIRQGLWDGANEAVDNILNFCSSVVPESFKPMVKSTLDKGIKKTKVFENVERGFFKDHKDTISISWEDIWKNRYSEEVAKA